MAKPRAHHYRTRQDALCFVGFAAAGFLAMAFVFAAPILFSALLGGR